MKRKQPTLADILEAIDLNALREIAVAELASGQRSLEDTATSIAQLIDGLLPFDALVPGAVGAAIEKVDDKLVLPVARLVVAAARKQVQIQGARAGLPR